MVMVEVKLDAVSEHRSIVGRKRWTKFGGVFSRHNHSRPLAQIRYRFAEIPGIMRLSSMP